MIPATPRTPHLTVFNDKSWGPNVGKLLVDRISAHPAISVCLPTGETPRPAYRAAAPHLDLRATTVFLLDEFELPQGSHARCEFMLERDLLGAVRHRPGAYHRLDANAANPAKEVARFDALVSETGLDLVLLGMGTNGHLGLNEPGSAIDSPTRQTDIDSSTTQAASRYELRAAPTRGMTLGLLQILAAREIWLLVTGSHKAEPLDGMLNGPITPEMPATLLRTHSNVTVLADKSALND